jgi:flagellar basal-body rod protein FlgC
MPVESVLENARNGMVYERSRLDAASRNIAGANVPVSVGGAAKAWRIDPASADFGRRIGDDTSSRGVRIQQQPAAERLVLDPGHPMADADGMVRYPAIDMVEEMTAMMTASRGYEANVRSFNLLRGMMMRALEIGAK